MGSWIEYTDSKWRDFNMDQLKVDEAYLNVISEVEHTNWLYIQSEECYSCPYTKLGNITKKTSKQFVVNTAFKNSFRVFDKNIGRYVLTDELAFCEEKLTNFGEFGVYNMTIFPNRTCSIETDKAPVNLYLPLLLVAILVIAFISFINGFSYIRQKYFTEQAETTPTNNVESSSAPAKKRLKSLDTVRGIAIVLMIFVNSGGGSYKWIEHASWNGLHFADIVFPLFVWIMGVCIPISIKSQMNRNLPKTKILYHIFVRSVKLFLIGFFINTVNGPNLETVRIMGVLQRFGICYFVVASVHTICSRQNLIITSGPIKRTIFDIYAILPEWIVSWSLIAIYLGITFGLNVPGCPKGYLGPGGKHDMAAHINCTGGAAGYIDHVILGNHIYQHPTAKYIYDSKAFDPEGIFGCLLSIVQAFLGLQCGVTLVIYTQWWSRVKRWTIWCLVLGILGGTLCLFSKEDGWIPINKNLWSLSFVMVTSSIAFCLLTICYILIDVKSWWSGWPLSYCGMNAIIMYIGHGILHKMLPWHWKFGLMNTHFILLLECTWNTILWVCIACYLYSKKIFYTV